MSSKNNTEPIPCSFFKELQIIHVQYSFYIINNRSTVENTNTKLDQTRETAKQLKMLHR